MLCGLQVKDLFMFTRVLCVVLGGFGVVFSSVAYAETADIANFSTDNYVEWNEIKSERSTRADSDIPYSAFKAGYATDTLTADNIDVVIGSMMAVLGNRSDTVVKSFDPDPTLVSNVGFGSSASSSVNGFYNAPKTPSKDFNVTWGSISTGTDGTVTYPVTGEQIKFGTPPDNYTIQYAAQTVAALQAQGATDTMFNEFMVQLWAAMNTNKDSGGRVILGDDTTDGVLGSFRLNSDGTKWSFTGSSVTYADFVSE